MPLRVKRTDSLGLPSWPTVRALYVEKARKLPSKLGLLLAVGAYGAPYMACHRMNGSPSRTAAGRGSGGSGPQRAFSLEEAPPLAAGFFTVRQPLNRDRTLRRPLDCFSGHPQARPLAGWRLQDYIHGKKPGNASTQLRPQLVGAAACGGEEMARKLCLRASFARVRIARVLAFSV